MERNIICTAPNPPLPFPPCSSSPSIFCHNLASLSFLLSSSSANHRQVPLKGGWDRMNERRWNGDFRYQRDACCTNGKDDVRREKSHLVVSGQDTGHLGASHDCYTTTTCPTYSQMANYSSVFTVVVFRRDFLGHFLYRYCNVTVCD